MSLVRFALLFSKGSSGGRACAVLIDNTGLSAVGHCQWQWQGDRFDYHCLFIYEKGNQRRGCLSEAKSFHASRPFRGHSLGGLKRIE